MKGQGITAAALPSATDSRDDVRILTPGLLALPVTPLLSATGRS